MKLLGQIVLQRAAREHSAVANAIAAWIAKVEAAGWSHFADLRASIPSADYVPPSFTVFNVRGNAYRLICIIDYGEQLVIVRDFLTHAEYDEGAWK